MTTVESHTGTVTIQLDGEPLPGVDRHTTPDSILRLGDLDPADHYLVRVEGRKQHSYQGHGDEQITVHEQETFVSVSTGPKQVA